MSKKKADDYREQPMDVVYSVRIRTFGKPAKHVDQIGESLARIMQLNFTNTEVKRGKTVYGLKDRNEIWGPLVKDSDWVDSGS